MRDALRSKERPGKAPYAYPKILVLTHRVEGRVVQGEHGVREPDHAHPRAERRGHKVGVEVCREPSGAAAAPDQVCPGLRNLGFQTFGFPPPQKNERRVEIIATGCVPMPYLFYENQTPRSDSANLVPSFKPPIPCPRADATVSGPGPVASRRPAAITLCSSPRSSRRPR